MLTDKYIDVREALGKTDLLRMGGVVKSVHLYPLLHEVNLYLPPLGEGGLLFAVEGFKRIAFPILYLFRIWSVAAKLLAVATGKTVPLHLCQTQELRAV